MTTPSANPYVAPTSDVDQASAKTRGGAAAARIAGAFLALNATVGATFSLLRLSDQPVELPPAVLPALVGPPIGKLAIDWFLAVPLLRGSVRFRNLTWIRAGFALVFPLAMGLMSYGVERLSPERAGRVLDKITRGLSFGALFAIAIVSLVTTRPNRVRTAVGLVCIAVYMALHFL